jgi:hypothetical protein
MTGLPAVRFAVILKYENAAALVIYTHTTFRSFSCKAAAIPSGRLWQWRHLLQFVLWIRQIVPRRAFAAELDFAFYAAPSNRHVNGKP